MNFLFLEPAETEFDDAVQYYDEQLQGLGQRFRAEVLSCLGRIQQFPHAYQQVGRFSRRCLVNRFPYGVIYQPRPEDVILVVAIAHLHRRPEYWSDRVGAG